MSFLDNLSDYLRVLGDTSSSTAVVAPTAVDPATVRMQLIRILERLESGSEAAGQEAYDSALEGPDIHRILRKWQERDAVVRFAKRLSSLLRQSFGRSATTKEMGEWIEVAIARRFGLRDSLTTQVRTLELDRLAEIAVNETFLFGQDDLSKLDTYTAAVRATRTTGGTVTLTAVGRVFLDLTGRDAIRWLLYIETAQSTGPRDAWRLSRETARALLQHPHQVIDKTHARDVFDHHWSTLNRMNALGLVSIAQGWTGSTHLDTTPLGLSLLTEVEKEVETPMSILANSLLADLTLSAGEAIARRTSTDADDARVSTAAEATARQARMVAHEIRNTLVPVKTALGAMYREVLMESPSEVLTRRRERIDRGIDATFRFIEQLVQVSKLAATPPESFDLLPAIQDALASIEQEAGHRIDFSLPDALPPVSGHRARVVMALANVLRNASQAVPQQEPIIRIRAEAVDAARAVLVIVEDNGPGVPANMRRAIFDEGTSLRAGGSGLGLALVREVFEKEIRGLVACDASPLGGARFTIRIPVTGVERP